jgi:hypothetical protein
MVKLRTGEERGTGRGGERSEKRTARRAKREEMSCEKLTPAPATCSGIASTRAAAPLCFPNTPSSFLLQRILTGLQDLERISGHRVLQIGERVKMLLTLQLVPEGIHVIRKEELISSGAQHELGNGGEEGVVEVLVGINDIHHDLKQRIVEGAGEV